MAGKLSVVATPIGNLEDITLRALKVLKEADFVLCEDTRVTKKLLSHYGIKTPTVSYHQHSGELKTDKLLSLLSAGKHLAMVTDAGTPGISDPGSRLVEDARERFGDGLAIEAIPGPSALGAFLAIAGLGAERFVFLGFLPHKKGRETSIRSLLNSGLPAIVYESKHRIAKLLEELSSLQAAYGGKIRVALGRELTKMFESFYAGPPEEVLEKLRSDKDAMKGEFVAMIKVQK